MSLLLLLVWQLLTHFDRGGIASSSSSKGMAGIQQSRNSGDSNKEECICTDALCFTTIHMVKVGVKMKLITGSIMALSPL
jgi:hypothetical protein